MSARRKYRRARRARALGSYGAFPGGSNMVPLLLLGGAALLGLAYMNRKAIVSTATNAAQSVLSWVKPIVGGFLTSLYGTRVDPVTGAEGQFHNGVDFGVAEGTPVLSPAAGRVIGITVWDGLPPKQTKVPNGNSVRLDLGGGYRIVFLHMSRLDVKLGDTVAAGQQLGLSGNTGYTTGPHLHISMTLNGAYIDPMSVPSFKAMFA